MYNVRNVTDDLFWIGANDRRLAQFEGVYKIPKGVSYNSYIMLDEKTCVFDTADHSVSRQYIENVAFVLGGRPLDYIVVQHMEMDHAATLEELVFRHKEVTIVCNQKTADMMHQFFDFDIQSRLHVVAEGDTLSLGKHTLTFVDAPMVHWPEVMMTYDITDKTLFSADAFGTFGAINGALFSDEVDFFGDYLDEARRYYTNIVGKYGPQVMEVLGKASGLEIARVCPLHGFVWRKQFYRLLSKYIKWATYTPEKKGVVVAYASVYGNTMNAADILASRLVSMGIETQVFDVNYTPADQVLAACFEYSHIVFLSTTYNAGIYILMEDLLHDIVNHNLQNRTYGLVENGSWLPASGGLMKDMLSKLPGSRFLDAGVTIRSSVKAEQVKGLEKLADALADDLGVSVRAADVAPCLGRAGKEALAEEKTGTLEQELFRISPADIMSGTGGERKVCPPEGTPAPGTATGSMPAPDGSINPFAMGNFSSGLFVLTAKDGSKDNGCIINTAMQVTDSPKRMIISVNKENLTRDMILKTGQFNISVLSENVDPGIFTRFGHQSGKDADKFEGLAGVSRSANGLCYLTAGVNTFVSCKVIGTSDFGTHTVFFAEVTEAAILSEEPSAAYSFYHSEIKPFLMPVVTPLPDSEKHWVCNICGYDYEGDEVPSDYVCPICKHGADTFSPVPEAPVGSNIGNTGAKHQKPASGKKRWVCKSCGWVYDGSGEPTAQTICPGCGDTEFEEI